MEFLKEILGDDLYEQVKTKVSSYNEKADKNEKVSIANVNNGEFIAKAKYSQLETDLSNTKVSLETANNTIKDLKKSNGDNADLQTKIQNYEIEKKALETKHKEETQRLIKESAIKDALYNSNAKHPDLLLSKFDLSKVLLDEKGENVVAGIKEQIEEYKGQYKDLFDDEGTSNSNQSSHYNYVPANGTQNNDQGATDFLGIIQENSARKI